MEKEKVCQLWGKVLEDSEVMRLQCWLMREYNKRKHLKSHEWAKQWVDNYSDKCRKILEEWVTDVQDLTHQLYW